MKKILLLGAQGLLGMQFLYDFETEFEIIPFARFNLDLSDTQRIAPEIRKWQPEAVINAAAWTAVEEAEKPHLQEDVWRINAEAPRAMARACKELGIPLLHLSTDFVFQGQHADERFSENSSSNPINFYGRSKAAGEQAVLETHPEKTYVIRTAWLYGEYGLNFLTRIHQLAKTQQEVRIVNDQFGNPTWTKPIAATLAMLLKDAGQNFAPGIYHAVSEVGATAPSWYDFAVEVFRILQIKTPLLPIPARAFASEVKRPISSVLINTKLPLLSNWKEMLATYFTPKK